LGDILHYNSRIFVRQAVDQLLYKDSHERDTKYLLQQNVGQLSTESVNTREMTAKILFK